jgi:hypothetical protein
MRKMNDPRRADPQILSRLERLEAAVFGKAEEEKSHNSGTPNSGETLPDRILKLRDTGFFNPAKAPSEVRTRLNPNYPCELDRVTMALLRLQRRRALRKTSKIVDGKKCAAYVW